MATAPRRLTKELEDIQKGKDNWIKARLVDNSSMFKWKIQITGPEGSPYQGGFFVLDVDVPTEYPFKPPKVKFATPIYHPNIKANGELCAAVFDNWSPQLKLVDVMITIRQMLTEPHLDNPLEPEIATLYKNDKKAFLKKAGDQTKSQASNSKF